MLQPINTIPYHICILIFVLYKLEMPCYVYYYRTTKYTPKNIPLTLQTRNIKTALYNVIS